MRDEKLAISAVVTQFLAKVVCLWSFAPYWLCTEIIVKRTDRPSYDFVLTQAVTDMVNHPDLCRRLLDAFKVETCTKMPRIGRIIFFGGVKFALTRLDAFLMQNVVAAARARERNSPFNPILADSSQCLQDAFTIRTSFKNFPPSGNFKLPDPPAGAGPGELTPEFLVFNKTCHNSLFALAG
jgi:hypothetical protein